MASANPINMTSQNLSSTRWRANIFTLSKARLKSRTTHIAPIYKNHKFWFTLDPPIPTHTQPWSSFGERSRSFFRLKCTDHRAFNEILIRHVGRRANARFYFISTCAHRRESIKTRGREWCIAREFFFFSCSGSIADTSVPLGQNLYSPSDCFRLDARLVAATRMGVIKVVEVVGVEYDSISRARDV